jgi:hypothetical protein
MKYLSMRYIFVILAVLMLSMLVTLASDSATVLAQDAATVEITSPADGATVSGIIEVVGSVDFPDFQKYEIFLKVGDNLIWGATVFTPVMDGVLARLDTKIFEDGSYQLIVRQVRTDFNYDDFAGPTITLENNLGAPNPFPEVPSSPLYPPFAGALIRIENCSGVDLEFDYAAAEGTCSPSTLQLPLAQDFWIMARPQGDPLCTTIDVLLIPCEYRGTAWGSGEDRAVNYSYIFEHGKVYEILYPGGAQLFINEIPGDDPTPSAMVAPSPKKAAPAPKEQALPITGRITAEPKILFAALAIGLISFMVLGGVLAMRQGKQPVE